MFPWPCHAVYTWMQRGFAMNGDIPGCLLGDNAKNAGTTAARPISIMRTSTSVL